MQINVLNDDVYTYLTLVKSISPSLLTSQCPLAPHVQPFFDLLPQAQAFPASGVTFSTEAFSQLHFKAGCSPQEQVEFLAQIHSLAEQDIIIMLFINAICVYVII
ncbi:unnamed protein product [Debaryomyces fabryi]|nr:unnamed protein product [Debaryomyces fabryi]